MAANDEFTAALDRLVERDYVRLVRAVALFSGTMDGAEDAVQEALARALEQSRKRRHIECLEAWVVTTASTTSAVGTVNRPGFRRGCGY
jgi:DNA-directed RNA polymerase specialized sigma24 family protein